ncbi:MAG TPA: aminotransferase class I/II-fold pyridoxal phosphate-dependent enzyme [Planctomycetes bacterium]|nr:aminotransferase class I/II-fold pyridoxal phosphate-dependent enzyme [Planctomycetota bacterium]
MTTVDLRSDTVTHPTAEMYQAIGEAPLGDDVFSDDPTVNALENEAAELLDKDAAIFVPSGTMANTIAIAISTCPGDEMVLLEDSHIYLYEAGGSARLWGVHPRPLVGRDCCLDPPQVEAAVRADDVHHPRTSLVCLENTHNMQGGRVIPFARIDAVSEVCRRLGLKLHLDGARIFHAAVKLGVPASRVAAGADTVSFCLSKGLSCPAGSLLCGSAEAIEGARRVRKVLGGGMRQAGILAACGRVALDSGIDRLADDHRLTEKLADGLRHLDGAHLSPDPPESNILFIRFEGVDIEGYQQLQDRLETEGVRTFATGPRGLRMVVHRQVDGAAIDRTLEAFSRLDYRSLSESL